MEEIGFEHNGVLVPYAGLPPGAKEKLSHIAWGGCSKGATRKALYSDLVARGCCTEGLGLVFEHGANALLPGGPLSFVPMAVEFEAAASLMELAHAQCGVDRLLSAISERLRDAVVPLTTTTGGGNEDHPECDLLPCVYHLPLPLGEEYGAIQHALSALRRKIQPNGCPIDQLRSLLVLVLCERGIPMGNLRAFAPYYSLDSFFIHGGTLYFAALIQQADAGLGTIPISIGEAGGIADGWLNSLDREPNRRIFHGRSLSDRENGMLVRRLHGSVNVGAAECGKALAKYANLKGLLIHGGMLTAAMTGSLIIKPNYYDVGDVVNAHGRVYSAPMGLDGNYWISPYRPTIEQISERLDREQLVRLAADKIISGRNHTGRPRRLGPQFADPVSEWTNDTHAAFFRRFRYCPSTPSSRIFWWSRFS